MREDRAGDSPTPGTAQAHFSPDACVFVAKYDLSVLGFHLLTT